jgi:hypothetical protein
MRRRRDMRRLRHLVLGPLLIAALATLALAAPASANYDVDVTVTSKGFPSDSHLWVGTTNSICIEFHAKEYSGSTLHTTFTVLNDSWECITDLSRGRVEVDVLRQCGEFYQWCTSAGMDFQILQFAPRLFDTQVLGCSRQPVACKAFGGGAIKATIER